MPVGGQEHQATKRLIHFIDSMLQQGGDASRFMTTLSDRKVFRLAHCLCNGEPAWLHVARRDAVRVVVQERINDMTPTDLLGYGGRTQQTKVQLVLPVFTNSWAERLGLAKILGKKRVQDAFPIPGVRFTVGWKYNPALAQIFCNTKAVNASMKIELKSDDDGKPVLHQNVGKCWCNCGRRRQFVHQSSGHVKTTNLCIVENRELRRLFTKGTGFRLKSFFQDGDHQNSRWEIQRALKALRMAVKSFCDSDER